MMKQVEKDAILEFGMDEEKFKYWCKIKSEKVIQLRMARKIIETTLEAAFVGILPTEIQHVSADLNTKLLYGVYLDSREKHFSALFVILREWLQSGKEISGQNVELIQALNTEDIQEYKINELRLRGMEVDSWNDHPAKVLIQVTKSAMMKDHIFRMFKTMLYQ